MFDYVSLYCAELAIDGDHLIVNDSMDLWHSMSMKMTKLEWVEVEEVQLVEAHQLLLIRSMDKSKFLLE